jgi:hypothetical protein
LRAPIRSSGLRGASRALTRGQGRARPPPGQRPMAAGARACRREWCCP